MGQDRGWHDDLVNSPETPDPYVFRGCVTIRAETVPVKQKNDCPPPPKETEQTVRMYLSKLLWLQTLSCIQVPGVRTRSGSKGAWAHALVF